jgi:hypothetical protein
MNESSLYRVLTMSSSTSILALVHQRPVAGQRIDPSVVRTPPVNDFQFFVPTRSDFHFIFLLNEINQEHEVPI